MFRSYILKNRWFGRRFSIGADREIDQIPRRELRKQFLCAAIPMVGFGFIDNTVMIRAGDAIDQSLGATFGMATLTAAAFGQVCSDSCGVLFGNSLDALFSKIGVTPPQVTARQRTLRSFRLVTTAGATVGIITGCLLGMCNLLFLDLEAKERAARQKELDTIYSMVMQKGPEMFNCVGASLFLYDKSRNTLWSKVISGHDEMIEIPVKDHGLTSWVLRNGQMINVHDAYDDPRFDSSVDKRNDFRTKSMLAMPIAFEGKVQGVLMLLNKNDGVFDEDDEKLGKVVAHHLSVSSPVNADLVKIIRQLEITPQTEEALETLIWGRSNDIQFAIASPMLNAEYIVAKLQEIIKTNPMSLVEKAKAKVCGQTPFNVNYAFEYLPYKAIVPSEMCFPIFIESQATGLIHARGDLALKCSSPVPELEATIIKKAAYSYSGYVGHICPFTHQLMAAGVDTHRSTNVPVQASIMLEIATGTVKVEAKQLASVTPQMTAVDIMHFHVKPFTTLKPNLLVDLIPIALSPATQVIKSQSPRKAFEMALGERLGLDLKIKAVTECEVSDKKTVLDSLRNYRYNPILAVIFQGSETALKMNGQPSVRFHRYTVVHNPAASTTKAIEMEIKLAAATKIRNTPLIKHIASRSPMKAMHEEMLDNSIAKLIGSEHILATNALVTVKLMGGVPKTLKLSKTLAFGLKDMELKWNVHLEEIRASPRMICMTGLVELPTEVQAIRKFKFQNKIGFGASCEEHAITMNGFTVTSQKQIEYRKREYICGMLRRQETALDQVQIEITATPNLPVQ